MSFFNFNYFYRIWGNFYENKIDSNFIMLWIKSGGK